MHIHLSDPEPSFHICYNKTKTGGVRVYNADNSERNYLVYFITAFFAAFMIDIISQTIIGSTM